jgi:hypothetical protein
LRTRATHACVKRTAGARRTRGPFELGARWRARYTNSKRRRRARRRRPPPARRPPALLCPTHQVVLLRDLKVVHGLVARVVRVLAARVVKRRGLAASRLRLRCCWWGIRRAWACALSLPCRRLAPAALALEPLLHGSHSFLSIGARLLPVRGQSKHKRQKGCDFFFAFRARCQPLRGRAAPNRRLHNGRSWAMDRGRDAGGEQGAANEVVGLGDVLCEEIEGSAHARSPAAKVPRATPANTN